MNESNERNVREYLRQGLGCEVEARSQEKQAAVRARRRRLRAAPAG